MSSDGDIICNLDVLPALLKAGKEVRHMWMQGSDIEWHVITSMKSHDSLNMMMAVHDAAGIKYAKVLSRRSINSMNLSRQPEGYWALT